MVDSFSDRSLMLINISLLLPNKVEMLSLCTCHISMAAAISLTFFPHTMKGRALLSFIIKLSQVERQFSYMPSPCWTLCSVTCSPDLFSKETNFRI